MAKPYLLHTYLPTYPYYLLTYFIRFQVIKLAWRQFARWKWVSNVLPPLPAECGQIGRPEAESRPRLDRNCAPPAHDLTRLAVCVHCFRLFYANINFVVRF